MVREVTNSVTNLARRMTRIEIKEPCAWEENNIAAVDSGDSASGHLFYITDKETHIRFLVDTWIRSQCHSSLCFRSKPRTRHAQFDSRQQHPHSHIWEAITQPQPWTSPSFRLGIHHRRHPQTDHRSRLPKALRVDGERAGVQVVTHALTVVLMVYSRENLHPNLPSFLRIVATPISNSSPNFLLSLKPALQTPA